MQPDEAQFVYTVRLGDNALVLAQRLIELVTHGPELEEELAGANLALDYLGQARHFYTLAGELEGRGRGEDDFAYLRDAPEFRNFLLVEQPNGHFGDTLVRQFLFDTFYVRQLEALLACDVERLRDIAARAVREVRYHLRHVSQWVVRLGDGTDESHRRVQDSLDRLWRYTGELFAADAVDAFVCEELSGPDLAAIRSAWNDDVNRVLAAATLDRPADGWMAEGGRRGIHSEHFGYLVAEMQHLPRTYPGVAW